MHPTTPPMAARSSQIPNPAPRSRPCFPAAVCLAALGALPAMPASALVAQTAPQRSPALTAALELARSETDADAADAALAAGLTAMPASASLSMRSAWRNFAAGRFGDAATLYGRAAGSPRAADAALWQAHSLASAERWPAAQAAYAERAARHLPIVWGPWFVPGSDAAPADRAIVHWRRATKDHPAAAVAWWLLGNSYAGAGRRDDALQAYDKAIALAPGWAPAAVAAAMVERQADAAAAAARLERLGALPDHLLVTWARYLVADQLGERAVALQSLERLRTLAPDTIDAGTLIDGALLAARAGDAAKAMAFLDHAVSYRSQYPRLILGADDDAALRTIAGQDLREGPLAPFWRYGFASSAFGKTDAAVGALQSGDPFAMAQTLSALGAFGEPPAEVQRIMAERQRRLAERARNSGLAAFGAMFLESILTQVLPHFLRAQLELEAVVADHPDSVAARVLLAAMLHRYGELFDDPAATRRASDDLARLVADRPNAPGPRLLLASWSALDVREDLLDGIDAAHAGSLRALAARCDLAFDLGDDRACVAHCLCVVHEHGDYWDTYETMGRALLRLGDAAAAKTCLEFSHRHGRTAAGLIALALLRAAAQEDGVTELLIDAWRTAPSNSAVETEAFQLLDRRPDLRRHTCQGCGGGRTVLDVSGSTYVSTQRVRCPQCLGLGLWHPGVR